MLKTVYPLTENFPLREICGPPPTVSREGAWGFSWEGYWNIKLPLGTFYEEIGGLNFQLS